MSIEVDREEFKRILQENEVVVTFIKKDGSERVMRATLVDSKIPNDKKPKGTSKRKIPDTVLPVWSVEDEGWRSIPLDRIEAFEVLEE